MRIRRKETDVLILLASCQETCLTYTIAARTVKTPDDRQRNCPKHVEFYSKNKFDKSVHLVGFILRMCDLRDITICTENLKKIFHLIKPILRDNTRLRGIMAIRR